MRELILGGARSGKSRLAQQRAADSGLAVCVIATASAEDEEMATRIARHRAERPAHWRTVEEPRDLAGALRAEAAADRCLLVDCLTLWLNNVLADDFAAHRRALLTSLPHLPGRLILVGNEVGLGVIPLGRLTRRFVDENGRLHQDLAALCDRVTLCAAGLPLTLKPAPG